MRQIVRRARVALAAAALAPIVVSAATVPLQGTFEIDEQVAPGDPSTYALSGYIGGTGDAHKLPAPELQSVDCINPLPIAGALAHSPSHPQMGS